jgi:hypothetical protein
MIQLILDKYIGYTREISSYFRPLFVLKYNNKEVCRLEDKSLLRLAGLNHSAIKNNAYFNIGRLKGEQFNGMGLEKKGSYYGK